MGEKADNPLNVLRGKNLNEVKRSKLLKPQAENEPSHNAEGTSNFSDRLLL